MKYMGSKSRIAKYIVPIIQDLIDKNEIKTYIEPFVGGANVIDKIKCETKIGSDNQKYLIALFENLDNLNTLPEFITKEHYSEVRDCFNKNQSNFPDWYIGAVGFLASYNGKFFDGGYAGIVSTKVGTTRNYYDEAKKNLLNQIKDLSNIIWKYGDYSETCKNYSKCLIYCDIPYKETTKYGTSKNFDYEKFWNWAEYMNKSNIVLVSEHFAPDNWDCIWKQEVQRTIDNNKRVKSVEKLFRLRE